jgi:rare lipoprotein A
MGGSRKLKTAAVLLVAAATMPSATLADSGGVGLSSTTRSATSAAVANQRVTVSEDGITVSARTGVLLHGRLWVSGTVSPGHPGATVVVQQSQGGAAWTDAATTTVGSDDSFLAAWRPQQVGRSSLRVRLEGTARVSPSISVVAYRPSIATLFGPGLWGNHTACGEVLRKKTLGVANRKLPCGTEVAIYYQGRTLVVPVIDRGPYANHANWDLTMATGRAVGMDSTATIGAMSLAAIQ